MHLSYITQLSLVIAVNDALLHGDPLSSITDDAVFGKVDFVRLRFESDLVAKHPQQPTAPLRYGLERTSFKSTMERFEKDRPIGARLVFSEPVLNEYQLSGFVGGGRKCFFEIVTADYVDRYLYAARLNDKSQYTDTGKREKGEAIWDDSLVYQTSLQDIRRKFASVESSKNSLNEALINIYNFASDCDEEHWAKIFNRAQVTLNEKCNLEETSFLHITQPTHVCEQALSMLSAISVGWVFGGMGSWNDGFRGEKDAEFSRNLYNALLMGLEAVAGESFEKAAKRFD